MRTQFRAGFGGRLSATVFLVALLAASVFAQGAQKYKELPNFHQVNENLYRGAQPRAGGMQRLKALGIRTILNLRADDENESAEETEVLAAGMLYFSLPMGGFSRPKDEQVGSALAVINDSQNWPVFVHCRKGADRTGTVIAIYRIEHDGWTSETAKAEAKRYGMSWIEVGMKDYIRDYYKRRQGNQ